MKDDLILDAPDPKNKSSRGRSLLIIILVGLVATGYLFRFLHWPFAGMLILFPSLALCGIFLYMFFTAKEKRSSEYMLLVISLLWLVFIFMRYLSKL